MSEIVNFTNSRHFDVTAVLGEYVNSQGETKKRYQRIGAIIDTKHGPMLKLDIVPLEWNGYAFINEPHDNTKPKQESRSEPRPNKRRADAFDDSDVPF